MKNPQDTP